MTAVTPETKLSTHGARWDALVWPRWLPVRARMPVVAQITGAVALTALLTAPWWSSIPEPKPDPQPPAGARPAGALPEVAASAAVPITATATTEAAAPIRPAHLNLEFRHSFASVDISVSVNGKPALQTRLPGSGKRFKMFGKRPERGYTRTIDLPAGASIVRVRVRSADDKFDQTRVERFDLGSASVATLRVSADTSGLSLLAERPTIRPAERPQAAVHAAVPPPAAVPIAAATAPVAATAPRTTQDANAVVDLLQSVRSILIAIAGFVASAATGFVVQEYLRSRRGLIFAAAEASAEAALLQERRRRRRPGKARRDASDSSAIDRAI